MIHSLLNKFQVVRLDALLEKQREDLQDAGREQEIDMLCLSTNQMLRRFEKILADIENQSQRAEQRRQALEKMLREVEEEQNELSTRRQDTADDHQQMREVLQKLEAFQRQRIQNVSDSQTELKRAFIEILCGEQSFRTSNLLITVL